MPPGSDHQLGIRGQNSGLYRNDSGASYPYDIGGLMSITRSSASSDPTGYYYFFYDIEIDVPCIDNITSIYDDELIQNKETKKSSFNILGKISNKAHSNQIFLKFHENGNIEKELIIE